MKNNIKLFGIIALFTVIIFSMAACKGKNSGSSGSPASPSGSTSTTIDSFLADYEKFVDDYISLAQKAIGGDFTALDELEKYGTLFTDWSKRLEGFSETDLTPAQARKLNDLTEKLTNSF